MGKNMQWRKKMKWFKHDTDASIDAKLQELLLDYGATGYGLYWYCVELIAQGVDKSHFTFELEHDARIIARNLNLTVAETTDMMKKMVSLNLFSLSKNNKLACYTLAKRLDSSMTSNKDFREMIANYKQSHDQVMIKSEKVMQEEKRREEKRTEDKRRKDNNIVEYSIDEDIIDKSFVTFWKAYPKKAGKKDALKAFTKVYKELPPLNELLEIIEKNKRSKKWSSDGGEFIPHPTTWLNGRRWEDEVVIETRSFSSNEEIIMRAMRGQNQDYLEGELI